MGSLEEEKLLQMVHDFIECETTSSPNYYTSSSTKSFFILLDTLQDILKDKTEEERKIEEKVGKYMRNKLGKEKTTGLKQWLVKCLRLDGFQASLIHSSWLTNPSCPCGSYEYIEIIVDEDARKGGSRTTFIVDIDFKSQFEVVRPTQSYKQLLHKLPSIFIGREAKLNNIITLLCSAAEESLREQGLHIPPWRRLTYMQCKWNLSASSDHLGSTNRNRNSRDSSSRGYDSYGCTKGSNHGSVSVTPQVTRMNERRRQVGFGGAGLSNQFSKMSINCC